MGKRSQSVGGQMEQCKNGRLQKKKNRVNEWVNEGVNEKMSEEDMKWIRKKLINNCHTEREWCKAEVERSGKWAQKVHMLFANTLTKTPYWNWQRNISLQMIIS